MTVPSSLCGDGAISILVEKREGIANFLCNGNYACSGSMAAVDKVAELAKPEFKARMAVKLAVAGAFHTDFMAPAVAALSAALADSFSLLLAKPILAVCCHRQWHPHLGS